MSGLIRVERVASDGLTKRTWDFIFIEDHCMKPVLYLDRYVDMERPSRRHGFKERSCSGPVRYDRLSNRPNDRMFTHETVPLPDDVADEARRIYSERVQVRRWDRK